MGAVVEAWAAARPGLDARRLHVLGRVPRIKAAFRRCVDRRLAPFGLNWDMVDLLATLWRAPGRAMRRGGALPEREEGDLSAAAGKLLLSLEAREED